MVRGGLVENMELLLLREGAIEEPSDWKDMCQLEGIRKAAS